MDNISIGIIIAQIINFAVLFWIFKHFLGDKIVKILDERKEKLAKLETLDDDIKAKLLEANTNAEEILKEARNKAGEIEKNSESLAKKDKEKIILNAETQATSIMDSANKTIEKERLTMMSSIKTKVIDLSLKLNEKLFDKERVDKDFMEKELNSINT